MFCMHSSFISLKVYFSWDKSIKIKEAMSTISELMVLFIIEVMEFDFFWSWKVMKSHGI